MTDPGHRPLWRRGEKTTARELCRQIIADTPYTPVTGPSGVYGAFLAALLTRHPDAAAKIGPGIAAITAGPVPGFRSRGFTVHRTDGTSTDFSWLDCIKEPSYRDRVLIAMRNAIAGQVLDFKQSRVNPDQTWTSDLSGKTLTAADVHIDHLPPGFTALADAFATAAGGYEGVPLVPSADGMTGRPLEPWCEIIWTAYHRQQARLQVLSIAEHQELTRKRRKG